MNIDFNPPQSTSAKPRRPWRIPLVLLLLASVAAGFILNQRQAIPTSEAHTAPAELTAPTTPVPDLRREVVEGSINSGETITGLLGEYFTTQEIHELASQSQKVFPLSEICAGQPYKLCLTDGAFDRFEYDIDQNEQLIIRKEGDDFDISRIPIAYTVKTELLRGKINSSLFEAVAEIGENPELAMALADIFAWDIDFIRDIRADDSFQALVEKRSREGKPAGYGRILAAEFTNQGDTYKAFLFKDGDNPPYYYDADGNSLRKAFLRAPLAFTRISSGFSLKRFHPITKTWKAHPAIDYAAPTGTPIKSVGDGTIIKIGRTKYNGNFIKIRHNNSFETLYLHMSRFARGMRQGKRVAQGQVIGYVGSTGLATGPHLCFRMYRNGSPINPNKVKTASAAPVSKKHLGEFKEFIAPIMARFEGGDVKEAQVQLPPSVDSQSR